MFYLLFLCITAIAFVLTWAIKKVAIKYNIVDDPAQDPSRKLHKKATPLLGGLAVYLTFAISIFVSFSYLSEGYLLPKHIIGILIAGAIVMFGGIIDDLKSLSPKQQFIFPILAIFVIIISGIGIEYITNPLGGVVTLDQFSFTIYEWKGLPYKITLLADLFTLVWLLGTMYTTKLLDGVDGLVPGISVIGGIIIFFLSMSAEVFQPETAIIALIFAACMTGFLLWNIAPAKIFLGEGGSLLAGFILGVLAILSGGKIATTLLILGLPIMDVCWVIIRRVFIEKKSPFKGDALHLHHQLKLLGLSDRLIAFIFYLITLIFGLSTLFVSGTAKLVTLIILAFSSAIALYGLYYYSKNYHNKKTT